MKIRVRNRVTGKEYECREDDFIRARKKGAALVRIGDVVKPTPSFLIEDVPAEEVEKPARKRKRTPRKKTGE